MSSKTVAQTIYNIGDMYMLYAGIFNLILGILGNISMILVFTTLRVFKGNQSAFYLTVESISNIGLLCVLYVPRILIYILDYDPVSTSLNLCRIRAMFTQIFGLCSLSAVCFLSFDQYLSTNLQHYWRQMSTLKLAHCLTFVTVSFAILHSIIFFIFTDNQPSLGCTVYNPTIKHYLSYFYYPILTSTLPLIFTVTTSLLAYYNVRRIIRRQMPVLRRHLDRQMTAMTLARFIVFVTCGVPFICISLYELNANASKGRDLQLAIAHLVSSILYSLLYTNFSINFYVFLMVSSRFRRQAKSALFKKCWRLIRCQCERRMINVHQNRVYPEIPQPSNSAHERD